MFIIISMLLTTFSHNTIQSIFSLQYCSMVMIMTSENFLCQQFYFYFLKFKVVFPLFFNVAKMSMVRMKWNYPMWEIPLLWDMYCNEKAMMGNCSID